jgi:hypothetical protein
MKRRRLCTGKLRTTSRKAPGLTHCHAVVEVEHGGARGQGLIALVIFSARPAHLEVADREAFSE